MANLDVQVAVLTERIDTMEEQAELRAALQSQMNQKIDELMKKLDKQSGFVAGVLAVFTAIGALLYYLSGPLVQLLKWKHG